MINRLQVSDSSEHTYNNYSKSSSACFLRMMLVSKIPLPLPSKFTWKRSHKHKPLHLECAFFNYNFMTPSTDERVMAVGGTTSVCCLPTGQWRVCGKRFLVQVSASVCRERDFPIAWTHSPIKSSHILFYNIQNRFWTSKTIYLHLLLC